MRFPYSGFLSPAPDTGEQVLIFRPEVPLRIFGPAGSVTSMALVDTGADNTILPLSIAHQLQIKTEECKAPSASAFGGQQVPMKYKDVQLALSDGQLRLGRNDLDELARDLPEGNVVRGTVRALLKQLDAGETVSKRLEFVADE
jgi:hypothetical protein